ncbi:MAG: hypothetical protein H6742_19345 [Alphaproteobacteria bacterium]|nr:hypothetical protein [Alphaproteobacteria bacterium]
MTRPSLPALAIRPLLAGLALSSAIALSPAWAGPMPSARDELARRLQGHPSSPEVGLSCAPSATVFSLFSAALLGQAGMDADGRVLAEAVRSADGLRAVGIDPDGSLGLSLWSVKEAPRGVLSLPFSGDGAQAVQTLAAFGLAPEVAQPGLGEWRTADGTVVRLADGELSMAFAGTPPADGPGADLPLVQGLPDDPGCAFWARLPGDTLPGPQQLRPDGPLTLAGFIPFARGGTAVVRVRPQGPPPAALRKAPAAPVSGSSVNPPSVVVHLGVSLDDLLGDPAVQKAFDLSPTTARRISKRLRIGAGTTVAAFGNPAQRELVGVIPIDDGASDRKHTKRVARLARKADMDVVSKGDETLVLASGEKLVFIEFQDGRAYAGSDAGRVREAASGQGTPWVSADELQWLMSWPVAAFTPADLGGGGIGARIHAGLRATDDDVFELGVQVKTNAPPGALAGFLTQMLSSELAMPRPGAGGADEAPTDTELLPPPPRGTETTPSSD